MSQSDKPGKAERIRKRSAAVPCPDEPTAPAAFPPPEPSEDFGRRRDIESADESPERHDRRHHDPEHTEVDRPV